MNSRNSTILSIAEAHEMRKHSLYRAAGHRLTPRVNSITAAFSSSITIEIGSQATNSNASTAPCKSLRHRRLAPAVSEERKHLDGRVADEFDIVVNGIEYEIKLPLLHGRIKRR